MEREQEIAELKAKVARLEAQIARSDEATALMNDALLSAKWCLERWTSIEDLVERYPLSEQSEILNSALAAYKACKNFQQASDELEEASKRWHP